MIARWQPNLWIHGHVHRSFDYSIGKTRVICNPRGYPAVDGSHENLGFDMFKIVEVPTRNAFDRLAKMADDLEAAHGIYNGEFEGGKVPKAE